MLYHPIYYWKNYIKPIPRNIKFHYQKKWYGFSDYETYNLYQTIAEEIYHKIKNVEWEEVEELFNDSIFEEDWITLKDWMFIIVKEEDFSFEEEQSFYNKHPYSELSETLFLVIVSY